MFPWRMTVGSESNWCDGNDGDSVYSSIDNSWTDDWDWIDDDGDYHAIREPDPPHSDVPAHMNVRDPDRQGACFHMNVAGCD